MAAAQPSAGPAPVATPQAEDRASGPAVGQRVSLAADPGVCGVVRYVGPTHFAAGDWVGIALDEPRGKNDGSVKGVRYFECNAASGLFLRATAVLAEPQEQEMASPASASSTGRPGELTNGAIAAAASAELAGGSGKEQAEPNNQECRRLSTATMEPGAAPGGPSAATAKPARAAAVAAATAPSPGAPAPARSALARRLATAPDFGAKAARADASPGSPAAAQGSPREPAAAAFDAAALGPVLRELREGRRELLQALRSSPIFQEAEAILEALSELKAQVVELTGSVEELGAALGTGAAGGAASPAARWAAGQGGAAGALEDPEGRRCSEVAGQGRVEVDLSPVLEAIEAARSDSFQVDLSPLLQAVREACEGRLVVELGPLLEVVQGLHKENAHVFRGLVAEAESRLQNVWREAQAGHGPLLAGVAELLDSKLELARRPAGAAAAAASVPGAAAVESGGGTPRAAAEADVPNGALAPSTSPRARFTSERRSEVSACPSMDVQSCDGSGAGNPADVGEVTAAAADALSLAV